MLHILTSDAIIARPDFERTATSLLKSAGPRMALHLRSRALTGRAYLALARRLVSISQASGAEVIVSGRLDIALTSGASGIQLGRGALNLCDVRKIAPRLGVGLSIHSVEEAHSTPCDPDWLIAGPVYATATHPATPGQGISFLKAVVQATDIPVIAVGGVRPEQLPTVLGAGAAGVAVVSGVWGEQSPNEALTRYLLMYADWFSREGGHLDRKRALTQRPAGDDVG